MIPSSVKIKNRELPEAPGVYLMKDAKGGVLYVGKAASLKRRVNQYWTHPHGAHIEEMVGKIASIDYAEQPTVIEALVLEANLIKQLQPPCNILQKDQKSFLYLAFTKDPFPKPLLIRGADLEEGSVRKYKALFGPYTSAGSLRAALDVLRKIFPWSACDPHQPRSCFYAHLHLCPGVCIGAISQKDYGKIIRDLIRFFQGKKQSLIRQYQREMKTAAQGKKFELAAELRNKVFALEHIQDVAVIKKERDHDVGANLVFARSGRAITGIAPSSSVFGRIEGYDISTISGASSVGSMVVFEHGAPAKSEYRKFKIKTVEGANDTASLQEVIRRRFRHPWRYPDLILVDGGRPQARVVERTLQKLHLSFPVIGIAKGPKRKRNDFVLAKTVPTPLIRELAQRETQMLLERVRDEAHRFAIAYHKKVRGRGFLNK